MRVLFIVVVVTIAGIWWNSDSSTLVANGAEVYAQDPPSQGSDNDSYHFDFKGYRVTPLAEFAINAKVLSRKNYSFGREADLSPVDFALGWGDMADPDVLSHIDISQSGRWYRWQVEQFPIPRRAIETQSANMHIIPADDVINDGLDDVSAGDVIRISGKLVRVDAEDGWHWVSSLTRDDTGARACEVLFVDSIDVLNL